MTATLQEVAAELEARVPGRVRRGELVSELTTYRLGGPLAVAVHVDDERMLGSVAEVLSTAHPAVLVIGRGSNLLVADAGFAGVGIVLSGAFDEIVVDRDASSVSAGAAVPLPVLARRAAAAGIAGLEFLVGIPGSVGGAVRMNAGGHGADIRDVLSRAWVCPLVGADAGRITERDAMALELGYRRSNVGPHDVVTRADVHGGASDPDACASRIDDVVRWRREHQPGGANAGSVFRNPPGDSAGRLIDAAGCKGLRVGGAVVSEKHANFFQADPGATADDVYELVGQVRRRVVDHSGVCLVPELQMIGFDDPSGGTAGAGDAGA